MSLITLNGVPVPCFLSKGVGRKDLDIGPGLSQAYDGSGIRGRRSTKTEWTPTTWIDTQVNTGAVRNLLNSTTKPGFSGSDHWQFDNQPAHYAVATALAYSDKGAQSLTLSGATPATLSLTGGKWSTGGKVALSAATSQATFGLGYAPLLSGSIFGCWHNDAGTWNAYLLGWNAAGTLVFVYLNGVAQSLSLPAWFSLGAVNYTVTGTGTSTDAVSDVFYYPFAPGDATTWASGLSTQQLAGQWPNACYLALAGDLGTANVVCVGTPTTIQPGALGSTYGTQGTAYATNNEFMQFSLRAT